MYVFGIETSCDETSCAVVNNGTEVLSNVIASSARFHQKFGGVIPEIASRSHLELINKVAKEALRSAKVRISDIDLIAVTKSPGLFGSLVVGVTFAKALSFALGKPLVEVDHVKAHLYSPWLTKTKPKFPFLGLVVSGGHTNLFKIKSFNDFSLIGKTVDDAAGEAFDKAARILGLGYPGGPVIDRLAKKGNSRKIKFHCEGPKGSFNFSFSGVKTALLYKTKDKSFRRDNSINDIAASFQSAVIEVIAKKTFVALAKSKLRHLVVGGGVAANSYLREIFNQLAKNNNVSLYMPSLSLCSDNAALIAGLGYRQFSKRGGK